MIKPGCKSPEGVFNLYLTMNKTNNKILTFPRYVVPALDEQSIAALFLEDGGQKLCDELTQRVLGDLVHALHLVDHVGIVHLRIWKYTHSWKLNPLLHTL